MTSNGIFAAVAVGIFLLLCVVTWYLVQALKQARLTALAMEQFLITTRPRVEVATEKLGSLIGRTDRLLAAAEEGRAGAAGLLGIVGQALTGWKSGAQAVSAIAAAVAAIVQTWSALTQVKSSPEAHAAAGGTTHD